MDKLKFSGTEATLFTNTDGLIFEYTVGMSRRLYKYLKEWRLEEASIISLPAYCVMPNTTLNSLVNALPTSINMLWLVNGIGKKIIETYGNAIINLINSFLNELDVIDIAYSKYAFDIQNKRVEGILGFLGYNLNNEEK